MTGVTEVGRTAPAGNAGSERGESFYDAARVAMFSFLAAAIRLATFSDKATLRGLP